MGVNSLPKTVTRQRRGCDLNPGPSALVSSALTTRLPSHPCLSRCNDCLQVRSGRTRTTWWWQTATSRRSISSSRSRRRCVRCRWNPAIRCRSHSTPPRTSSTSSASKTRSTTSRRRRSTAESTRRCTACRRVGGRARRFSTTFRTYPRVCYSCDEFAILPQMQRNAFIDCGVAMGWARWTKPRDLEFQAKN